MSGGIPTCKRIDVSGRGITKNYQNGRRSVQSGKDVELQKAVCGYKKSLRSLKCVWSYIPLVFIHGYPNGSHTSQVNAEWRVLGEKISRSEIVYLAQLFMCVAQIITCVVMLTLLTNREYWMVVLSSLVHVCYIMHSCLKIKFKENRNDHLLQFSAIGGRILNGHHKVKLLKGRRPHRLAIERSLYTKLFRPGRCEKSHTDGKSNTLRVRRQRALG